MTKPPTTDAAARQAAWLVRLLLPLTLILLLGLAGACEGEEPQAGKPIDAWVSILPQAGLVETIGGDRVRVHVLVRPGESPETYQPTPRQLADLSSAQVYFRIGVPFEDVMLAKIAPLIKGMPIVDTRQGIRLRPMNEPHDHDGGTAAGKPAAHGDHDEGEGEMDPHVWLDPNNDSIMATTIRDTLIRLDPAGKDLYEANARRLSDELKKLDTDLRRILTPHKGREIFVYHPAFGYFTGAYGLRQVAIEAGGREPGPRGLANLIDLARQRHIRVIFVQPQFDQKNAETIAKAIGGAVVRLDPLAPDLLANLRAMADEISRQYTRKPPES